MEPWGIVRNAVIPPQEVGFFSFELCIPELICFYCLSLLPQILLCHLKYNPMTPFISIDLSPVNAEGMLIARVTHGEELGVLKLLKK